MARGVFRRRHYAPRRRFVPHGFAAGPAVVLRRWRARLVRQRHRAQRRRLAVFGVAAPAAVAPGVVRRQRVRAHPHRLPARHRPYTQSVAEPAVPGQGMVFGRFLRAVQRIRRAMQRRLAWREPPDVILGPEEIPGSNKGRIFCPGLVRGRVGKAGQ